VSATHHPGRLDHFWANAHRSGPDACWPWRGPLDLTVDGPVPVYRRFENGPRRVAQRMAYEIAFGVIQKGRVHPRCGAALCVNPLHLALSLQRLPRGDYRGAANPRARLREADVRDIRARAATGTTQRELAAEYLVTEATISFVVSRKLWGHVV
jgi:hypothetical protein